MVVSAVGLLALVQALVAAAPLLSVLLLHVLVLLVDSVKVVPGRVRPASPRG